MHSSDISTVHKFDRILEELNEDNINNHFLKSVLYFCEAMRGLINCALMHSQVA